MKNDSTNRTERDLPARELGPLLTRIFRGGRTWFVGLTGPLDTVSVDGFRDTITKLLGERCRSLVLDLRRVSYADSQGIRALLLLRDQMMQRRGRLRLVIPEGSRVRRTLQLLRLDALFQIYATPVEAWRSGRLEGRSTLETETDNPAEKSRSDTPDGPKSRRGRGTRRRPAASV
jgi:anti-anti-sigma factor